MKVATNKENLEQNIDIICRGCNIGERRDLWGNYERSLANIGGSYLELEEEPENIHDPNAVKVICCGEVAGPLGYAGREFTEVVKKALGECEEYYLEMLDRNVVYNRSIRLKLYWR